MNFLTACSAGSDAVERTGDGAWSPCSGEALPPEVHAADATAARRIPPSNRR
jgi:hypothetical protein